MAETRGGLISRAKARADFDNDANISATQWNDWALSEMRALWRRLVRVHPDHLAAGPTSFTLTGTIDTYALSTLSPVFWKMRALDYDDGGTWTRVRRFSLEDRNRVRRAYRVIGANLRLTPAGDAAGTYRIWYIPEPTAFVDDNSQIDAAMNMYDELIVLGMAIRGRKRQQKEAAELMAERAELIREIMSDADDRDEGEPESVIDADAEVDWEATR